MPSLYKLIVANNNKYCILVFMKNKAFLQQVFYVSPKFRIMFMMCLWEFFGILTLCASTCQYLSVCLHTKNNMDQNHEQQRACWSLSSLHHELDFL
jgi:hypothetical protein